MAGLGYAAGVAPPSPVSVGLGCHAPAVVVPLWWHCRVGDGWLLGPCEAGLDRHPIIRRPRNTGHRDVVGGRRSVSAPTRDAAPPPWTDPARGPARPGSLDTTSVRATAKAGRHQGSHRRRHVKVLLLRPRVVGDRPQAQPRHGPRCPPRRVGVWRGRSIGSNPLAHWNSRTSYFQGGQVLGPGCGDGSSRQCGLGGRRTASSDAASMTGG